MLDPALHALLSLVQRELAADDAYLQLGGRAEDTDRKLFHPVQEATNLVVCFAEPPADLAAVRTRVAALSENFRTTLDSAASGVGAPRYSMELAGDVARQRLDEELSGLANRAGAVRAFVIDFDSPVIWGASSVATMDGDAQTTLLDSAAHSVRNEHGDELRQVHGHTVRLTLPGGVEALVRPFAGLYALCLLFRDPVSEPIALGAVLHAIGLVERLVLALPPIDPGPGAKVIRLPAPRG